MLNEDDEVIYENKMIEKIILQSPPKQIIYYQNINDTNHTHSSYADFEQFKSFMENNKLDNICIFNSFNESIDGINPHLYQYPKNTKQINILKEFLKTN
jgi:hypothetical protein